MSVLRRALERLRWPGPAPFRDDDEARRSRRRTQVRFAAVTMVRDESDIIGCTIEHLLNEGIDLVIVANNLSADSTVEVIRAVAAKHPGRVELLQDDDPAYWQSRKMTKLARRAAARGAEWVIPFDADEIWHAEAVSVAEFLGSLSRDVGVVVGSMRTHLAESSGDVTRCPFVEMRFRLPQEDHRSDKVAFRVTTTARRLAPLGIGPTLIQTGNHDVVGVPGRRVAGLTIRHFPYRARDQLERKLRTGSLALAQTDYPTGVGVHWRVGGRMGTDEFDEEWARQLVAPAVEDPAPIRCRHADDGVSVPTR